MPIISPGALALWVGGASAVGAAASAGIQASAASKARKQQKRLQESTEDRATIESAQVQAASNNLDEADIAFESEASKADSKAASAGSRLLVGRGKKAKSGVKL